MIVVLLFSILLNSFVNSKNVAIIGSGYAGLCSAKHSIERGYKVTIFEQTDHLGGIWYFNSNFGKNEYGVNIHTALFPELRTNGPIQTMELQGFHFPNDTLSFPFHSEVLRYLEGYATFFQLNEIIKFNHRVIQVVPYDDNKWIVSFENNNSQIKSVRFDAVFICNGHNSKPFIPKIVGLREFTGKILHSSDFRNHTFKNESVLVIGGGNSGREIVERLNDTFKIVFSQRKRIHEPDDKHLHRMRIYSNIATIKGEVQQFNENGAVFKDKTTDFFDTIIFATGFDSSFPFLSIDCGLRLTKKRLEPVFRKIIHRKTMAFVGGPSSFIPFYDLQALLALKYISDEKEMPSDLELLEDIKFQNSNSFMYSSISEYSNVLAQEAGTNTLSDSLFDLVYDVLNTHDEEPFNFRNYKYTLDNVSFKKEKI